MGYIKHIAFSSSNSGSVINSSCSLSVGEFCCTSRSQFGRSVCSITVTSLESSEVSISITSISSVLSQILLSSVLSEGSLGELISNSKFESGKPNEPSLDEIMNGRSVSCLVFWLGRLRRFNGFVLLYILHEEEDGAGEGVGDEVDTELGSMVVVGLVVGPGC